MSTDVNLLNDNKNGYGRDTVVDKRLDEIGDRMAAMIFKSWMESRRNRMKVYEESSDGILPC